VVVGAGAEELNTIILEDQALPQILGYTFYVYSIPNVEIDISLNILFFILSNTYKKYYLDYNLFYTYTGEEYEHCFVC